MNIRDVRCRFDGIIAMRDYVDGYRYTAMAAGASRTLLLSWRYGRNDATVRRREDGDVGCATSRRATSLVLRHIIGCWNKRVVWSAISIYASFNNTRHCAINGRRQYAYQ